MRQKKDPPKRKEWLDLYREHCGDPKARPALGERWFLKVVHDDSAMAQQQMPEGYIAQQLKLSASFRVSNCLIIGKRKLNRIFGKLPGEAWEVIHVLLECFPMKSIGSWVHKWIPNASSIVDEVFVEAEGICKSIKEDFFMDCEV